MTGIRNKLSVKCELSSEWAVLQPICDAVWFIIQIWLQAGVQCACDSLHGVWDKDVITSVAGNRTTSTTYRWRVASIRLVHHAALAETDRDSCRVLASFVSRSLYVPIHGRQTRRYRVMFDNWKWPCGPRSLARPCTRRAYYDDIRFRCDPV